MWVEDGMTRSSLARGIIGFDDDDVDGVGELSDILGALVED